MKLEGVLWPINSFYSIPLVYMRRGWWAPQDWVSDKKKVHNPITTPQFPQTMTAITWIRFIIGKYSSQLEEVINVTAGEVQLFKL